MTDNVVVVREPVTTVAVVSQTTVVAIASPAMGPMGPPGPPGTGDGGGSGVVAATAPATYDSGTQTIGVTVGTTAGTVAAGNDSRLSDARTPTAHTHPESDVTGLTADLAAKAAAARLITAGTGLTGGGDLTADRTLAVSYGTTAGTAAQGNDTRITGAAVKANNLSDLASAATARTNLGLGNVDNTSDANKPVSTAQAAADALAIPQSVATAKGDLLVATGSGAVIRRAVGSDAQVLTADSTQPDGVKWATAAGGGGAPIPTNYLAPTGASYETFPRNSYSGGQGTPGSGQLYVAAIALPAGLSVGRIAFVSAGAANTPTHWWFGLYDSARVQLATTADQTTTAWAANTLKSVPIANTASGPASTFTTTYTGLHYLAFLMTAAAIPGLVGTSVAAPLIGAAPILNGTSTTGLTTPPAFPFTAAAVSASVGNMLYAYVGP